MDLDVNQRAVGRRSPRRDAWRLAVSTTPRWMRWSINGTAPAARCSDIAVRASLASRFSSAASTRRWSFIDCAGQPSMVGKHRFRCVAGDLRHQLGELRRVSGDVDGPVELVVETHRTLVVIAGRRHPPAGPGSL